MEKLGGTPIFRKPPYKCEQDPMCLFQDCNWDMTALISVGQNGFFWMTKVSWKPALAIVGDFMDVNTKHQNSLLHPILTQLPSGYLT